MIAAPFEAVAHPDMAGPRIHLFLHLSHRDHDRRAPIQPESVLPDAQCLAEPHGCNGRSDDRGTDER